MVKSTPINEMGGCLSLNLHTRAYYLLTKLLARCGCNVWCCLCGRKAKQFLPFMGGWKAAPAIINALDIVGSDLDHHSCPHCGCTDRERHLFLYLDRLKLWKQFEGATVLHFAPERAISSVIESAQPLEYLRADLFPASSKIEKIDLMAIPCGDSTFDILIVNHVLEHVQDDIKALNEIHRVLKPGGIAILQTPYSAILEKTFCDNGIDTNLMRHHAYGQEDHVRLYGKDIFKLIESVGFQSEINLHSDVLYEIDSDYHGVNPKEPLFLFRRILDSQS